MRFTNLILGVALLLTAITLALTITIRNAPGSPASSAAASEATASSPPGSRSGTVPSPARTISKSARPERVPSASSEALDLSLDKNSPAFPSVPLERQELAARTSQVRDKALQKLNQMTERFDLTRAQRNKIFPLLVQSTPGFHPAMVVPGGAPGTGLVTSGPVDEEIHDALDPEQQEKFQQDAIDRGLWWEEIAGQLLDDYDSAVAAATAPEPDPSEGASEPAGSEQPAEETGEQGRQGGNLFEP